MHEQAVVHRGWPAWQGIVLLALTHAAAVQAAPKDMGTVEAPEAGASRDEFAVRAGVEWGSLSAPTPTTGFGSSGPSIRFSALARLPWAGHYGCGLFAAFDAYFASGVGQWVAATSRTAVGAFFEWDASR